MPAIQIAQLPFGHFAAKSEVQIPQSNGTAAEEDSISQLTSCFSSQESEIDRQEPDQSEAGAKREIAGKVKNTKATCHYGQSAKKRLRRHRLAFGLDDGFTQHFLHDLRCSLAGRNGQL